MKTAFVFTGCGALGAFQAGAAYGLKIAHGIEPDNVYGVSSGAINAIAYSFMGTQGNIDFWSRIRKFSDAFQLNWNLISGDGVFRHGKNLTKWMREHLESETCKTECLTYLINAENGAIASNRFLKKCSYGSYPFTIAMSASAIPGMCQSWDGYVDAGTRIIAPLKDAILDGAERIFIISGRVIGLDEPRKMFWPKAAAAAYYGFDSALGELLRRDLELALDMNEAIKTASAIGQNILDKKMGGIAREIDIQILQPRGFLGGPLEFEKCREFIELGKSAAFNLVKNDRRLAWLAFPNRS